MNLKIRILKLSFFWLCCMLCVYNYFTKALFIWCNDENLPQIFKVQSELFSAQQAFRDENAYLQKMENILVCIVTAVRKQITELLWNDWFKLLLMMVLVVFVPKKLIICCYIVYPHLMSSSDVFYWTLVAEAVLAFVTLLCLSLFKCLCTSSLFSLNTLELGGILQPMSALCFMFTLRFLSACFFLSSYGLIFSCSLWKSHF